MKVAPGDQRRPTSTYAAGDVPAGGASPGPARVSDHVEGPSCDGQRDHANGSRGRTQHTMALDQSALLEVLEALKAADVDDRIRAATTICQALIEAHLTAVIGSGPARTQRRPDAERPLSGPTVRSGPTPSHDGAGAVRAPGLTTTTVAVRPYHQPPSSAPSVDNCRAPGWRRSGRESPAAPIVERCTTYRRLRTPRGGNRGTASPLGYQSVRDKNRGAVAGPSGRG